jgi:hypothetical protein
MLTQNRAGDKIENNEMSGAFSSYDEGRSVYMVLVGKPEGKRTLWRPRYKWRIILKWNFRE